MNAQRKEWGSRLLQQEEKHPYACLVIRLSSFTYMHKSDQHLISPYRNSAKSFIKVMRIKRIIMDFSSFDC